MYVGDFIKLGTVLLTTVYLKQSTLRIKEDATIIYASIAVKHQDSTR